VTRVQNPTSGYNCSSRHGKGNFQAEGLPNNPSRQLGLQDTVKPTWKSLFQEFVSATPRRSALVRRGNGYYKGLALAGNRTAVQTSRQQGLTEQDDMRPCIAFCRSSPTAVIETLVQLASLP
jgi:hypothetical protein